jgi:hypothetical protein
MVSRRPSEWIMVRVLVDMEVAANGCCEYCVDLPGTHVGDDGDDDEGDLTFCLPVTFGGRIVT